MTDDFNPLEGSFMGDDAAVLAHVARGIVTNILDSYHGKLDAFVEILQNSMDAIEEKWREWEGQNEAGPSITVTINATKNTVMVVDNGTGIPKADLRKYLVPNFSPKSLKSLPTRGHKGVGTTYLAYGHNTFELHSKIGTEEYGYRLEGGLDWTRAQRDIDAVAPLFKPIQFDPEGHLSEYTSGVVVKIEFGQGSTLTNIGSIRHHSPKMWRHVLTTLTAIGHVTLGSKNEPEWLKSLKVHINCTGKGRGEPSSATFPYPHTLVGKVSAQELQSLQNNPNQSTRNLEVIYLNRNHTELKQLLKEKLAEVENKEDFNISELFSKYEVEVYASLTWKNTLYEELNRKAIGKPDAERLSLHPNLGGGVQICSTGMPIGSLMEHFDPGIRPELRRRFFLLLNFNSRYRPDLGRKTISSEVLDLVRWLEKEILTLLRPWGDKRLIKDADAGKRRAAGLGSAAEEVAKDADECEELWNGADELPVQTTLKRFPRWEQEVVAHFVDLLTRERLRGYELRALPGNEKRYDGLFNYSLSEFSDVVDTPDRVPLGVHRSQGHQGRVERTKRWLEFKVDLEDLLQDFEAEDKEPSKKYFAQVELAVVWNAECGTQPKYEILTRDSTNWISRVYYGSTHVLRRDGDEHVVEVIEIRTLLKWIGAGYE